MGLMGPDDRLKILGVTVAARDRFSDSLDRGIGHGKAHGGPRGLPGVHGSQQPPPGAVDSRRRGE